MSRQFELVQEAYRRFQACAGGPISAQTAWAQAAAEGDFDLIDVLVARSSLDTMAIYMLREISYQPPAELLQEAQAGGRIAAVAGAGYQGLDPLLVISDHFDRAWSVELFERMLAIGEEIARRRARR